MKDSLRLFESNGVDEWIAVHQYMCRLKSLFILTWKEFEKGVDSHLF
jgi:hypothetical protein